MRRCDFTIPTLTGWSANGMQQGLHSKSKGKQFHLNGLTVVFLKCCRQRNYTQNSLTLSTFTNFFIYFFSSEDSYCFDSPFLGLVSLWPSSDILKINYMHRNSELNYIYSAEIKTLLFKMYLGKTKLFKIDSYAVNLSYWLTAGVERLFSVVLHLISSYWF